MILADTSIWVEMFRKGRFKAELAKLIADDQLCAHPYVVAELACGDIPNRQKALIDLDRLSTLPIIPLADVRIMIEARSLAGKGIGLTDVQLIASCLATPGTHIWTLDAALARVTQSLGILAMIKTEEE
jgi:predicted nucleic acid-binding protein